MQPTPPCRAASRRRPPGRSRPPGVPRSLLQARGRRRRPGGRPCSLLRPSLRHGRTSNQEGSPCRNDRTTNVACPSSFGGGLPSLCSSHLRGRSYRPAEVTSRHHGFCVRPSRAGRSRKPASSVKSWAHGNMLPMWLLPPVALAQACFGSPPQSSRYETRCGLERHEFLGVRKRRLCSNRAVSGTRAWASGKRGLTASCHS